MPDGVFSYGLMHVNIKSEVKTMLDFQKILNERHADVVEKINEYNAALKANDLTKATRAEHDLKEAEGDYASVKRVEVFNRLSKLENPIKAAIETYSYFIVSHQVIREDGVVKGFKLIDNKVCQIDLVKFCEHCNLPTKWQYLVEKFNQLLALRTARELKMTTAQIKKICDSFYMSACAREVDMGGTPDSNTAIAKLLQTVVDGILFEDDGKGKNKYRVNSHDVAYLLMCYTKRGKKVLSVAVAKNSYVHRLVFDVMYRIVTGKVYDLEYKMVSSPDKAATTQTKAEAEKKSDESKDKAEAVVVEKEPDSSKDKTETVVIEKKAKKASTKAN